MKDRHDIYAIFVFVVCFTALCASYTAFAKHRFTVGNDSYEEVGVMRYDNKGEEFYIPVFKRK